MIFAVSFYVYLQTAYLERKRFTLDNGTCQEPFYSTESAWNDMRSDQPQGFMDCFCKQMFSSYGEHGMKVLFEDGQQHCQDWYVAFTFEQYSSVILAIFIALMNLVLHLTLNWMGQFRRPKSITAGKIYQAYTILLS